MNSVEMNMKLLQVFDEVYRTRSVSKAAEQLGISQPSISLALNKLRKHFKDTLFVRTSTGMEATPLAQQLLVNVRGTLHLLDQTFGTKPAFDPASSTRRFNICITDITQMVLLPLLLARLKSEAPQSSLFVQRISERVGRQMESGEVDLVVGFVPDMASGIYQQRLLLRDFVCIASVNHPRVRKSISLPMFEFEGHLVVTASGSGLRQAEEFLAARKVKRKVLLQVPDLLGMDSIIGTSELIATVPRPVGLFLAKTGVVKVLEHPLKIPSYQVKQHWHERFHLDPANQWLRGIVAEIMNPKRKLI